MSHTRRSPPGLSTIEIARPDCAESTSAKASVSCALGTITWAAPAARRSAAQGMPRRPRPATSPRHAAGRTCGRQRDDRRGPSRRSTRRASSATAATTSTSPAVALSTNCRDCSWFSREILSRRRAARSNSSAPAAASICVASCVRTSSVLPEEHRRGLHVVAILGLADQPHARRAAPLDLVQHARARAVGEHGVVAGTKLEHLLQERDPSRTAPALGNGPK